MGNCGTKPKVLMDSDDTLPPVREVPDEKEEATAAAAAAAARRSEKGKEIMIETDIAEEHESGKRPSLSHLFEEDKQKETIQAEKLELQPMNQEMTDQSSTEVPKPGASFPEVSEIMVSQPLTQEIDKSQSEVPKMESSVPVTSEANVSDVSMGAEDASGAVSAKQTPQDPVFMDAQEIIEPDSMANANMTVDDKKENKDTISMMPEDGNRTVSAETQQNEKKDETSTEKADKTKASTLEFKTEDPAEEKKTSAGKPEVFD